VIKIVLDTNMFLSALLYGGMVQTIFDAILDKKLQLCVSPDLRAEVLEKLKEFEADGEVLMKPLCF
jgi:putative PIN family toxin of toxin-antitoxin system